MLQNNHNINPKIIFTFKKRLIRFKLKIVKEASHLVSGQR